MKKLLLLCSVLLITTFVSGQNLSESFESPTAPATDWTLEYANVTFPGGNTMTHSTDNAFAGTQSFRFSSFSNGAPYDQYLVTPRLDVATNDSIVFWYAADGRGGGETFSVGTSTTGNASGDFTFGPDVNTSSTTFTRYVYPVPAGTEYVAIHYKSNFEYYLYIDSVEGPNVFVPSCLKPTAFGSFGTQPTSTNLDWLAGAVETEWIVEYGTPGFALGSGTSVSSSNDTLNVTGLLPSTGYDFYLRAVCAVGDTSDPVGPIAITTPCLTFTTFPYTQNFDGMTASSPGFVCYTTDDIDDCWSNDAANPNMWAVLSGATGSGSTGPSSDNTSGAGQYIYLESSSCANTSIVYSPVFDLASLTLPQLEFAYHMYGANTGSLTVEVTIDGGATWSPIWTLAGDQGDSWFTSEVVLSSYVGATAQLRFVGVSGTTSSDIALDDISIVEAPSCPAPTALDAYDISFDTAMIGFIAAANDSSYIIEYGVAGFTPGTGILINGVEDTVSVSGLMESTTYEYYVNSMCSLNDTSELVGPFSFTTLNSCPEASLFVDDFVGEDTVLLRWTPGANDSAYLIEYGVTGFTPGSGMFVSGTGDSAAINGLMGATEYEFYLRTICTAGDTSLLVGPVTATTTCPASFVPTYSQDFTSYVPDCWTEATGTLTSSATLTGTTSQWVADGFANNGFTGAARMEIWSTGRDEWLITPTFDLGNGSAPYQVEFDVALTVWNSSNADTLQADDTLALVISTDNGATWSTTNIINTWDDGNEPSATGDRVVFNLSAYTGLVKLGFYAASTVSGEDVNVYIDNFLIREIPSCPELDSILVYNTESMQTDVTWKQGAADNSWVIEFDTANFALGTGNTIVATNDTTTILGLLPLTSYDVYVRNVCAVGDSGLWQGPVTFTTSADCPDPNTISDYLLARDSNNLTWIGGVADSSYFIEWDTAGFTLGSVTSNKFTSLEDTVVLTGLVNNTSYDFYVRTLCKTLDTSNWVGPFNFTTVESCPSLSAINSFNVDRDSLSLTWTAGQYDSVWLVEYDTAGFTPGSATSTRVTATTDSINITSLLSSTTYDFYIRAICTAGDTSVLVGPISATTLCPVIAAPYTQDFDSMTVSSVGFSCYTGDEVDDCWSNDVNNNNNWAVFSGATGSGGTGPSADTVSGSGNYLYTEASGCNSELSVVYSPEIDLTALTLPQVSFFYHMLGSDMGQLEVFASNDRGATWTSVWILSGDQGGNWNKADVVLSSYIGDTVIIKWEGTTGTGFASDMAIDAVSFEEAPACPQVSAVSFFGTTSDSTNLVYTPGFNDSAWFIEYGLTGFVLGTGNVITVTNDTVGIGGLLENTSFDFYVNSICSVSGDTSGFVGPISVQTLCDVIVNLPYTETFDDSSSTESCWTVVDNNNDGDTWDLDYTTNPFAGDEVANINTDFNSGANDDYLISPAVLLNGNQRIRFQTRAQSSGEPNDYEIVASSTGTNPADFTTVLGSDTISSETYEEKIYNLTGLTGNHFVAVRIPAGGLDGWRLYIDNFTIEDIPSCPKPLNLTAYNIGEDSAFVTWAGTASDSVFVVEYGVAGFAPGTGTIVNSLNDTLAISGLISNTEYEFYVRSVCSVGDSAVVVAPGLFKTECSIFTTLPFLETFDDTSSTEACWTVIDNNADGDAWDLDYTINPFAGNQVANINTDFNSGANDDYLVSPKFTLNGNQRIVFQTRSQSVGEPNDYEVVVSSTGKAPADFATVIGADTISSTTYEEKIYNMSGLVGDYYIAVKIPAGGLDGWRLYIDNFVVEDIPSCPKPTVFALSNPGTDSINFTWVQGLNDSSWVIEYGPIGYTPGTGTSSFFANDTVTLNGLTPDTPYDFYLRSICTAGDTSVYVGPLTDSTLPTCPVPTNLVVNNPTTSTLDVTWTAGPSDVSWMLEYGPKGFTQGTGTVIPTATTFQQLTMLSADVEYDVYVRGVCGAGDSSRWIGPSSDTTLPTCLRVQSFTQLSADSVSINVGWNLDPSQTGFVLEFGPKGFALGSGTSVTLGALDNFYQATGLSPLTEYDFYIRAYCTNGDSSIFDGPFTFTTDCPSFVSLPWTEGFDSLVTVGNDIMPTCWLSDGDFESFTGTGTRNRGPRSPNNSVTSRWTSNNWLYTPFFNLDTAKVYEFSFWYNTDGLAGWDSIRLTNNSDQTSASVIDVMYTELDPTHTTYKEVKVNFKPSIMGRQTFAINVEGNGSPWYLSFDDFGLIDTAMIVGVDEETAVLNQFKVYPNPNNGNFTLLNEGNFLNTSVTVMDVQGRTVYTSTMFFGQGARKGVSLENTESGIYFLVIENNGRRELHRVVIE